MTSNTTPSGLDLSGFDEHVRPQDDLFGHANGGWVATTEIPDDRGRFGTFDLLRDRSQEQVLAILENAADAASTADHAASESDPRAQVGALYASFMDTDTVNALGADPLAEVLQSIAATSTAEEFWGLLGSLQREGVAGAIVAYVDTDRRESDTYVTYLHQSGLGLPDEAYYRAEEHAEVRDAYRAHLTRVFEMLERDLPEVAGQFGGAAEVAESVYALEAELATHHWDRVRARDAVAKYNPHTPSELRDLASGYPWNAWFSGVGVDLDSLERVIVSMPEFTTALAGLAQSVELGEWKRWAAWSVVRSWSAYLAAEYDGAHFDFYGRTLTGTPEQRERWRRGVGVVDTYLGEAVGRLYVDEHFSPSSKARVQELVANLIEAYRRDITRLDWMGEETKQKALEKLDAFTPKIGYPDTWRDYSSIRIDAADLLGNVRRATAFETDRDFGKLGGPVDRGEWFMNPQTVNAYYNPGMNEIVFPAAILQPPFFDAEADDAVNYGAIGSVIGHEIGHGFDDQGSRYDGAGNLVDWWTHEDRERFDERAQALITQYDGLSSRDLPGETVNGSLTVGENIGDLGGVTVAHFAYEISCGGEEPPVIDGRTGPQRFFLGWAQAWRGKAREKEARRLIAIDPHSPMDLRANIVGNLDEFHEAFDTAPGDGMWLEPQDRVRIW